jgi:RHS repeat-associated protein
MTRDVVGNLYSYDAENHQKTYTPVNPNEPNATYFYDGDGRRVKKQVGNEITLFVYDAAGALVAEYTINAPASTTPPQTIYLTADTLGSPRINTNQKGEIISRHDYLPFGDEIIGLGQRTSEQGYGVNDNVRKKFTGYEKDQETGLDFAQARYYGNGLGRFTSVDPSLESINSVLPQSWNRYVYVLNNPLNLIDPSGLFADPPGRWYWNPNDVDENGFYHPQYILNGETVPDGYTEMTSLIYWNIQRGMWTVNDPYSNTQYHYAFEERGMAEFMLWQLENPPPGSTGTTVREVEDSAPAQPTKKSGGPLSAVKYTSVAVDIGADFRMHHWVSHGRWFSETYGNYYKPGYYGNQYQPSSVIGADKSKALSRFGAWKVVGRASFFVGTGISVYKGVDAYKKGNDIGVMKSGADVTFGTLLTFGGPPGIAIGGSYFAVDATVGWGPVLRTYGQANENYRQANGRTLWQDSKVLQ